MMALSRAARSVVLYDAENEAVRAHLAEFQAKMRGALEAHGALSIGVWPFELVVDGAVVYEDRDREKSVAFRLYRDGVRALRVEKDVPWEELLALLQIIAVRYTGVRQQEDDTVTLLRKAEFRRIGMEYVEGFTPSEELPEPATDAAVERARRVAPPATWDTPLQRLPAPGPLAPAAVPDAALAGLRVEGSEDAADALAISVARDLVAPALGAGWLGSRDLAAFLDELREGLLADGRVGALRRLVDLLSQTGPDALLANLLRALAEPRTLETVLDSLPDDAALTPELVSFVPFLGASAIFEQLVAPMSPSRRRLLVAFVHLRLPQDADAVLARLPNVDAGVALDLARAVAARAPDRAPHVARHLLGRDDPALRVEALGLLETSAAAIPLRPVLELLRDPAEEVRVRAIELLGRRGDASALDPLCAALEAADGLPDDEAAALGRAIATLGPDRAAALFPEWLQPKARFLRGLTAQQRTLQWAAVAGTGVLPGAGPEATLKALAEKGDADLRSHCLRTLGRRRGTGHGAR
jgi:hypothetical protein